jgi:hypothetical protein
VAQLFGQARKHILRGCVIAFSAVFPHAANFAPERQALWRLAVDFGAVCVHELDASVTHLVCGQSGTSKVMPFLCVLCVLWALCVMGTVDSKHCVLHCALCCVLCAVCCVLCAVCCVLCCVLCAVCCLLFAVCVCCVLCAVLDGAWENNSALFER